MKKKILITGVAGFIGFSLARELSEVKNVIIVGIDNFEPYYSVKLKRKRIDILKKLKNFRFLNIDICNSKKLNSVFKKNKFEIIYNFAAQAGVRYSIKNPRNYMENNIRGFFNLLECCREYKPKKIFYASSSSVYGDLNKYPAKEIRLGKQKNIYSLSKKFNEELAEIYNNIYGLSLIGLRFFTVYGEWGRPDMFYLNYFKSAHLNKSIKIFNYGKHFRDFTYIRDVIDILMKLKNKKIKNKHLIFNICSNKPINLMKFIGVMNNILKKKCKIQKIKLQSADVIKTHGDNSLLLKFIKKNNFFSINSGLLNTYKWFRENKNLF